MSRNYQRVQATISTSTDLRSEISSFNIFEIFCVYVGRATTSNELSGRQKDISRL